MTMTAPLRWCSGRMPKNRKPNFVSYLGLFMSYLGVFVSYTKSVD